MAGGIDTERVVELFSVFGPVSVRRMFGGAGIYADGVMFALAADGIIYLKTGEDAQAAFEREHCAPFRYDTKHGRRTIASYWRMPDRLYDDPDALAEWARRAHAAARARMAPAKPSASRPGHLKAAKSKTAKSRR